MKKLILALALCLPGAGIAQQAFLLEDTIATKDVPVNAFIVNMPNDFDEAIDNYKKFVKEEYHLKVKKENSSTYIIEAVDLPHLSVKRGDLKTYLISTDSMNIMAFSFLLGYDIFLDSKAYPEEMDRFRNYVVQYMDFNYRTHYINGIEQLTKELDAVKKELRQSENKIRSMKKKTISLDKKVSKEMDESKKIQFDSERQQLENDIKSTSSQLPDIRFYMSEKEEELFKMKEELNTYHQLITAL